MVSYLVDEQEAAALSTPTVDIPRPDVLPPEPYTFPVAERRTLPNGLEVVVYDVPGQYVHSVRLSVPLPLSREPREREGVATIMARTLDEGTETHSSSEFALLLERKGVALGAGVSEAGISVDVDVAKRHLEYALDLLRQTLTEPAFPAAEVARHVKQRLAEIEQERSVAAQRGAIELIATFFDPDERSSRPTAGTRDTVAAITRDDVAAFHAREFSPVGATLVLAGDLDGRRRVRRHRGGPRRLVGAARLGGSARAGRRTHGGQPGPGRPRRPARLGPDRADRGDARSGPVGWTAAGRPTRSWGSCWAAPRTPASTRCCARRRATPTASGRLFRPRRRGGLFLTSGTRARRRDGGVARHPARRSSTARARASPTTRPSRASTTSQDRGQPVRDGGRDRRRGGDAGARGR